MVIQMKKLLTSSAVAALIASQSFAAYTASDTHTSTIDFVETIAVTVPDLNISNAVGGDTVDQDLTVTVTRDADRTASCTLSGTTITMSSANEEDFDLTAGLTGCSTLSIDGNLPTTAGNGKTYAGSVTITAAYDTQTN